MDNQPASVKAVFDRALEIGAADQRRAFLDQACAGAPALRQQVEALLQAYQDAGSFLEGPAPDLGATAATQSGRPADQGGSGPLHERASGSRPPAEGPGAVLGPYRLVQQLGEGGMGTVWVAEQTEPVRRQVALKVIKPGLDSRQVIARFEAERQALALMDHVNIARVLDAGATESGRPYFVMELVHGVPITTFCDDHQLTPRERLGLFVQVCGAVQHAHQKGVIHRDLKPSNVLVTLCDGRPVPKVIDFGIAKATAQKLTERTLCTQYGALVGTLEYMSPEQAELSALSVDTRSDIYSLGVLLYELLTGSTPLTHRRVREATYGEILRLIKEEEPPRPSARLSASGPALASIAARCHTEPARLARLVRGELDWIVMKTLEKDRNRRYDTASAFAADVQRYLNDEPVLACPPSAAYKLKKFFRRNKQPVLAAALVLVALLGGIIGTTWGLILATEAQADAVREAEQKERALTAARRAERARAQQLWRSHRDRARALRLGGQAGQRFEALKALGEAARVARPLEVGEQEILKLRNEAVACLALPDLRFERTLLANVAGKVPLNFWFALDPPFHFFVSSDPQGNVSIRRVADGEEISRLPAPGPAPDWVLLGFSPDGRRLAVAYDRAGVLSAQVWEFQDGKATRPVALQGPARDYLTFSPDGGLLAARGPEDAVVVYDVATGREVQRLPHAAAGAAFHPDGRYLGITTETVALVVDRETGEEVARYPHPAETVGIAWRGDGRLLAVGCGDHRLYVWDHARRRLLSVLEGHTPNLPGTGAGFRFSPGGDFLSTSPEGKAGLWDPVIGRQLVAVGDSTFVATRADGRVALLRRGERGSDLELWEVAGGWECRTLHHGMVGNRTPRPPSFGPSGVDFSPDGRLLATSGGDGIRLWDLASFTEAAQLPTGRTECILFHPDGNSLFTRDTSGMHRWPVRRTSQRGAGQPGGADLLRVGPPQTLDETGDPQASLGIHLLHCDRRGRWLATVDPPRDRAVVLELVEPGRKRVLPHPDVFACVLSPDGRWAVTWTFPDAGVGQTKVWDTADGKLVWEPPAGELFAFFSPEGRWLVTTPPGTEPLRFWEVGSWRPGPTLPNRAGNQDGLLSSPDGKVLLPRVLPATLVHGGTGRALATLEAPRDNRPVGAARFSPDGTRLAIATGNHTVHVWDLRALRRGLAEIGLDWDLPPYAPAAPNAAARPIRVEVQPAQPAPRSTPAR
jgi:serine/threonine protein kinase/WD40 repeat protein